MIFRHYREVVDGDAPKAWFIDHAARRVAACGMAAQNPQETAGRVTPHR